MGFEYAQIIPCPRVSTKQKETVYNNMIMISARTVSCGRNHAATDYVRDVNCSLISRCSCCPYLPDELTCCFSVKAASLGWHWTLALTQLRQQFVEAEIVDGR